MSSLRRVIPVALVLTTLCVAAQSAAAADTAAVDALLEVVPDNVLLVKVINRLDKLDQQVARLGQTIKTPLPGPVAVAQQTFGFNEGVDLTRSAGAALLSAVDRNGIPTLAVFIPVTDYQKFLAQLQPDDAKATVTAVQAGDVAMVAGKKGTFAVLCAEGNETQLRSLLAAQTSVAAKLKPLVEYLAEQDVGAAATTTGVQLGVNAVRVGLRQIKQQFANVGDEQQGKQMVAAFEMYDGLLAAIENGVGQFALGARIDDAGGVHVTTRTLFLPGGRLAGMARDLPGLHTPPLAKLPPGSFIVAIDGVMPQGLMQGIMKMSVNMLKSMAQQAGGGALTDEQVTKLTETAMRSMEGVHSMSMRWRAGKAGESIYDGMTGIIRTDDARKYIENYERSMAAMNELFKNLNNPLLHSYEVQRSELNGAPLLELTMDMSALFAGLPDAEGRKRLEGLFGVGGKVTIYLVAADDKAVVMAYVSKERLEQALAAYKDRESQGLAGDAQVAKTSALLLKDPHWVMYWSPQGTVDFARQVATGIAGGNPPFAIPEFPAGPPVGFAARVADGGLQTDMVLPADTLSGIADYVRGIIGR